MDIYEAGRQKVQRERESAGRMKAAAKSPLASTGGKGFQRGTAVSEKADEYVPSAPKTATEMGGAQDTGEPPVEYGQDSLNYLGHMAGDNVTAIGHNPGVKGTMEEFKAGTLHSGSKKGPIVKSRKQAIAIGLSQQRRGK